MDDTPQGDDSPSGGRVLKQTVKAMLLPKAFVCLRKVLEDRS